ncbi:MAG: DUF2339 domain-containing protein [Caldiserica bacterium]|nr:DUF2339 domain-containing protein [Caldisericota bacterium]
MSYGEKFRAALTSHQQSLKELEDTLKDLNVDVLADENIHLSEDKKRLLGEMDSLRKANQKLGEDLAEVRDAFRQQVINEKLNQTYRSRSRINLLFESATKGSLNRLQQIETSLTQRMEQTVLQAGKSQDEIRQKYQPQIAQLQNQMNQEIADLRLQVEAARKQAELALQESYGDSELGVVDDTLIDRLKKGNNFEIKLGLSLFNKLGVILVFLAVILAGRYTYTHWFSNYAKGITFYVLGLLFCVGGEWLFRRKMPIVAAGVTGGGIGLFYISTFICAFYLNILSSNMAMAVCVLIAVVSLVLTLRYKSPTIGMLSLIGGYLPFIAYVLLRGIKTLPIPQALAYVMVFNAVVLGISIRHKWNQVMYVGFLLNVPCVGYLLTHLGNDMLAIVLAYATFLLYLAVILYRNLKDRAPLNGADLALLGLNTLTNCSLVYYLFRRAGYGDYTGLLAILYAAVYFGLAYFVNKHMGDRGMINTFYAFAVGFSILVIPLQLSKEWFFFGWLIEACLYVYLGGLYRIKPLEYMGIGLVVLSHVAFVMFNGYDLRTTRTFPALVDFKYAALVVSEAFVAWTYWHIGNERKEEAAPKWATWIRYPIVAHISLFLTYEVTMVYRTLLGLGRIPTEGIEVLVLIWGTVLLSNMAFQRLRAERYMEFKKYRTISELVVYVLLIGVNGIPFGTEGLRWWLDAALLIGANSAILWRMNAFLKDVEYQNRIPRETRPVVLGSYTLAVYFIDLISTFRPTNLSVVVNISMILFSLLYIALGFRINSVMLRRMGLGLSLLATTKMLIIDSLSFSLIQKIISYFIFGLVLIAISFVYQRITKRTSQHKKEASQ